MCVLFVHKPCCLLRWAGVLTSVRSVRNCRIALAQCCPATGEGPETNLRLIEKLTARAAAGGADLVAFPEAALSGYSGDADTIRASALCLADPVVQGAAELSRIHSIYCCFGLFERDGDRLFNTYVLAENGKLIGTYRKIHVPERERGLFSAGSEFKVFELSFARVGLSICFDNEIPESHICLALKGAELIVMPSAWAEHWEKEDYIEKCSTDEEVVEERRRWMYMMFGARCRDTGTYSALVNHSGLEAGGPSRFVGKSMVFAPTGRVVAEACAWNDELLFADLDGDLLAEYRAMPCYALKSRRPDAYSELTKDTGRERRDKAHGNK